jgi:CBS-domain-containing membrane protein
VSAGERVRLPVRSCRVVGPGDVAETHHTVQCARQKRSIAFSRCCGCAHMISVDVDPDGQHGTVECDVTDGALPHGRVDVAEAAVRVRLGDVIGVDATCVRSDLEVEAVIDLIVDGGLRAVPVVDAQRGLVGIVSKSDLLRRRGTARTVSEVMTPLVHGLPEDAPVAYAISLMAFEGLHEVPVVDANSHVIGMVTANDALRWVAQALGYVVPTRSRAAPARPPA